MDPALLTAIASLIVAVGGIIGILFERKGRRDEIRSKLGELESRFLQERITQRYRTYPEVFKVLGAVRDVDLNKKQYESLRHNKGQLQEIADKLLTHLYGDAGLVMDMPTRNALLQTWLACHLFQTDSVTIEQLVGYFFLARRWLRADLQLEDVKEVKNELGKIKERFGLEASDKKLEEAI